MIIFKKIISCPEKKTPLSMVILLTSKIIIDDKKVLDIPRKKNIIQNYF